MRLKSIKLAGFKSFVDATTVPFPTNMTGIVGPNGCGKSNIIDAVRWVMGESSAKNLRGESMTDVIFNGSTGRQPVGQASIELLFDNSEGKLEGEHGAFAEISIKRKVTREGQSQYYLNGTKCRRRDVTDIFLGTGMGPRSYAIIEQGMIARLIESKPEELRVYLEEAAGISKYKERRRETENRMRRTQENLDRLTDLREELGKQLQHLKRQANAAERFAEFKQQERDDNAKLNAWQWRALETRRVDLADSAAQLELAIEQAVLDKSTHESQIEAARTELEERQEQFNKVQAKYYAAGAEIAKLDQQLKYQREQMLRQDQELAQLGEEQARLQEQQEAYRLTHEELSADVEMLAPELEGSEEDLAAHREALVNHEDALHAWQAAWETSNQETAQTRQTAELEQSRMQAAEGQLRQLQERKSKLEQESAELTLQLPDSEEDLFSIQIAELEDELSIARDSLDQRREALQTGRQALEALRQERSAVLKDAAEQRAVLASLRTLQEGALGDSEDNVPYATLGLDANKRWAERVVVEQGWEQAFETIAQPWIKALASDSMPEFSAELAAASGLTVMSTEGEASSSAAPNTLAAVVSGASAFTQWFSSIRLAETAERAFAMRASLGEGESVVSKDGVWLARDWVRLPAGDNREAGVIARAARIKELEQRLPEYEARLDELEVQQSRQQERIEGLEEELIEIETQLSERTQMRASLQAQQGIVQAKAEQLRLRIARNHEELAEIDEAREQSEEQVLLSREAWQDAMASLEQLLDARADQQEQREKLQRSVESARQQLELRQQAHHTLQLNAQQKRNSLQQVAADLRRVDDELARLLTKLADVQNADRIEHDAIEDDALRLEGMLEARLQDEEKLSAARTAVEDLASALRDIEGERGSKDARLQQHRSELESVRMELQALTMRQAAHLEVLQKDDYQLDVLLAGLLAHETDETLQQSLDSLAARIQRLGPINLAAIDEYREQSERKTYLDEQNEDLEEALETLMGAIRKIDKETRARFRETYDQVNEGLQALFPRIFGGGNAHLELTDDDLLETGVAIIARPPGKKNSTIHLLSGGEKALTAIALIFAIFQLNPAPFCMLDEVDAPLDDANVGRFANMVKEMSAQVQFIYISHNKVSMEKADQLMGVTMHEPGVSRLVSVDVEEAAAMANA